MPPLSTPSPSVHPRKSTLFCWECGHASPAGEGDWDYRSMPRGLAVRCPDCGTELAVRPGEDQVTHAHSQSPLRQAPLPPCILAGGRVLARSLDLAAGSAAWPCDVLQVGSRAR